MARVLLQLLCTALTLAFFFYQHNAHTQDTGDHLRTADPELFRQADQCVGYRGAVAGF